MSDSGELFIAYVASLETSGLSINYANTMHRQRNGQTETNTSLRESSAPQHTGSAIEWCSSHLDVGGNWQALARPVQKALLASDAGSLEWNCVQPNAVAEIRIGKGRRLEGLGYVEHLTMSIPPWQLPIEELRWGRFLSNTDALVWIDWRGAMPLNLVFHNGNQIEAAAITDHGFTTGDLALAFEENLVIREGPLIKTTLSTIPGIRRLFPLRVLRTYECKWLSRGTLTRNSGAAANGWAIHEVVRWA